MTEKPEPEATPNESEAVESTAVADIPNPSWWNRLNRTNRTATIVLGTIGAGTCAVLLFGGGVLVGAEYGDSEGHHDRSGGSGEYRDSANDGEHQDDGQHQDDEGDSGERENDHGDGENRGDGRPDEQRDQQDGRDTDAPAAPTTAPSVIPSSAAPHP